MWTILKFEKKNFHNLKNDIIKRVGKDTKFYTPKLLIKIKKNNKLYNKEFTLLGDYMFCFHKNFKSTKLINTYNNMKGLKYFLNGFLESQNEISEFVLKCKENENEQGFLDQNFFDLRVNKSYKFFSGPFTNQIFKIVELQKNKINILIGKINTSVRKRDFLFQPV